MAQPQPEADSSAPVDGSAHLPLASQTLPETQSSTELQLVRQLLPSHLYGAQLVFVPSGLTTV